MAAADKGIQILGGMGLSAETNAQRFWRDVRQFRIAPISSLERLWPARIAGMGGPCSYARPQVTRATQVGLVNRRI